MPASPTAFDGPNSSLVNEVVEFAFSDQRFGTKDQIRDVEFIEDFEDALEACEEEEFIVLFRQRPESRYFRVSDSVYDRFEEECIDEPEDECPWPRREFLSILCAGALYDARGELGSAVEKSIQQIHSDFYISDDAPVKKQIKQQLLRMHVGSEESCDHAATLIAHDLAYCAENRAVNGNERNFYEYTFQLHLQGVWPLIWTGSWPAPGKYRVWRPSE